MLQKVDVFRIHCSSPEETRRLIDAKQPRRMTHRPMLINTARGSVIDEDDLFDVLDAKQLGGAALDVFQHEPYSPVTAGKDLRTLENVMLTPHIGSNTQEANQRMAQRGLRNTMLFIDGRTNGVACVPAS